jgi:hypothetical protein
METMRLLLLAMVALPLLGEPRLLFVRARTWPNPLVEKLSREAEAWPDAVNGSEAETAMDLALAYQLTGKRAYAVKVRRILEAQKTDPDARQMVWFAFSYDMVRDTMTEPEQRRFETDVLKPAHAAGPWKNTALMAIAVINGNVAMRGAAVEAFRGQLRKGLRPDGNWRSYFDSLLAMQVMAEIAARAGVSVPESAALKRMQEVPLLCLFPDGSLPGSSVSMRRRDVETMLFTHGFGSRPPITSALLSDAGMAMLRSNDGDQTFAVRFGQGDRLAIDGFANRERLPGLAEDLMVDHQKAAHSAGKALEWTPGAEATLLRISAGPVYPGVEIERTLVLTARYLLEIVEARSTNFEAHLWKWAFHDAADKPKVFLLDDGLRRDGNSARFGRVYDLCGSVTAFREAGPDLYEVVNGQKKDVISIDRGKFRMATVPLWEVRSILR